MKDFKVFDLKIRLRHAKISPRTKSEENRLELERFPGYAKKLIVVKIFYFFLNFEIPCFQFFPGHFEP